MLREIKLDRDAVFVFAVGAVVAEIEFRFAFRIELESGGKGPPHLAAEAFQRPDAAVLDQLRRFLRAHDAARDRLPKNVIARTAAPGPIITLERPRPAFRTARVHLAEVALDGVAFEILGLLDDLACHVANLLHEVFALELSRL